MKHSNQKYAETYLVTVLTKKLYFLPSKSSLLGKKPFHMHLNCEISRGLPGRFITSSPYISYMFSRMRHAREFLAVNIWHHVCKGADKVRKPHFYLHRPFCCQNHSNMSMDGAVQPSLLFNARICVFLHYKSKCPQNSNIVG